MRILGLKFKKIGDFERNYEKISRIIPILSKINCISWVCIMKFMMDYHQKQHVILKK